MRKESKERKIASVVRQNKGKKAIMNDWEGGRRGWFGINTVEKEIKNGFFLSIYVEYIELYLSVCISWFNF